MVFDLFCGARGPHYVDDEEVEDEEASSLSYVGSAAYSVLRTKHARQHHALWNATSGKVIGHVHQTPCGIQTWSGTKDPEPGHSDWLAVQMADLLSKTTVWCDVMSLSPPDGLFMEKFQEALGTIAERSKTSEKNITIRMMFGNIVGMPVNCNKVLAKLTKNIPEDAKIRLWVGAWRKGVSWNHAKLIAVDGKYLHTGGHNMWDGHYLKHDPVHDLSLEMEVRTMYTATVVIGSGCGTAVFG
jgi:hypothetical protein